MPINIYTGFYLEHKYKLSNQTFIKYFLENLKSLLVGLVIGIPILLVFFYVINQFGDFWWLVFASAMFLISVVLSAHGEMKMIIFPSGDHAGWQAPSSRDVSCLILLPLLFILQICMLPERSDAKAISPPSGTVTPYNEYVIDFLYAAHAALAFTWN